MQPQLRIHVLGPVRVESATQPSGERLTRTLQGLLAFLVLNRRRTHSRDVLFGHFWGDQPQERARHCLNTAVWRLRQVLEPTGTPRGTFVVTDPDGAVGFRMGPGAWLDLDAVESAAVRLAERSDRTEDLAELDQLDRQLREPGGDLLEGFYHEWALEAREHFRLRYLAALTQLTRGFRRLGAPERALRAAEACLAIDPMREDVVREAMRAWVDAGNRAQAIRRFTEFRRRLRSEFGTDPMPETTSLGRQISAVDETNEVTVEPADRGLVRQTLRQLRRTRRQLTVLIQRLETSDRR